MARNALKQQETILCEFGQICATGNALMLLESILCEFGRICEKGNALMLLKAILRKFGQIYATGNALMLPESILCESGRICATGNTPMHFNHGQILHFEFSRLNHPLDIKNLPWNIMEAHGTKPKGARLEKKADISA